MQFFHHHAMDLFPYNRGKLIRGRLQLLQAGFGGLLIGLGRFHEQPQLHCGVIHDTAPYYSWSAPSREAGRGKWEDSLESPRDERFCVSALLARHWRQKFMASAPARVPPESPGTARATRCQFGTDANFR